MELMKSPKKSSKRHGLDLYYSDDSPSTKRKRSLSFDTTKVKFDEESPAESYSQDVVASSQQSEVSKKKSKPNKQRSKKRSTESCNTKSNVKTTEVDKKNASYISPKKERPTSEEENNLDDLKIEDSGSDEGDDKLVRLRKLKEPQINANTSNSLSNKSAAKAKSVKFSGTRWSAEDLENAPDLLKKKKTKRVKKVEKKQHNTLLTIMNNNTSSDTDNEDKINEDTFHISPNKKNQKNDSNPRLHEIIDSSDEEVDVFLERRSADKSKNRNSRLHEIIDSSDEEVDVFLEKRSVDKSKNLRKFNLAEEAKDVQEMISDFEAKNELPKDVLKVLSKLQIKLEHPVPPQHMVESCAGSRGPTKEQKKMMEKLGPIKYGKFTPEEDSIIMKNWRSFCETHDWNHKDFRPFLYMRHRKFGFITGFEQRQKFVQYLAHGLPWRTLYSVYWRFRNLCQPHVQTRYTRNEDTLILAHMKSCSAGHSKNVRKFSELAKILKRTRASVWRRYRLLNKNRESKNVKWNLRLVEKFIKNLMSITLCNNIHKLKDLDLPQVVWKKLSTKMKIPSKNLKSFWMEKLHMQLFCKMPIYLNDIRIKLIEYFYVKGISDWWEIEWSAIAKYFDGMTPIFLAKIFSRLFNAEKVEGMDLSEIIEYGHKLKKIDLQEALMDAFLPRISFENGTVKLLDKKLNNDFKNQEDIENFSD